MQTKIIKEWTTQQTLKDEETGLDIKVISKTKHTVKQINQIQVYESEELLKEKKQKKKR